MSSTDATTSDLVVLGAEAVPQGALDFVPHYVHDRQVPLHAAATQHRFGTM